MEALPSFETSETTNPAILHHIPKQLNHQLFLNFFHEKLKNCFSTPRKYSVLFFVLQVPSDNDGKTIITRYLKYTHTTCGQIQIPQMLTQHSHASLFRRLTKYWQV
jgi:hypothetical protein